MCTWTKQLSPGCLSQGQGVTPLEFQHMRERYRIYRPMDPSPEKTLMAQGEGGGGGGRCKSGLCCLGASVLGGFSARGLGCVEH